MPSSTAPRGGAIVVVLLLAAAALISAQDISRASEDGLPELLAEVRALRGELNQAAGASMRMQLLVARLTLQEQRITALGRQVAEVQVQLRTATQEKSATETRLREIDTIVRSGRLDAEDERQFGHQAKSLSAVLSQQTAREQQLRQDEGDLLASLAVEQTRWTAFNSRLDELEQSLSR